MNDLHDFYDHCVSEDLILPHLQGFKQHAQNLSNTFRQPSNYWYHLAGPLKLKQGLLWSHGKVVSPGITNKIDGGKSKDSLSTQTSMVQPMVQASTMDRAVMAQSQHLTGFTALASFSWYEGNIGAHAHSLLKVCENSNENTNRTVPQAEIHFTTSMNWFTYTSSLRGLAPLKLLNQCADLNIIKLVASQSFVLRHKESKAKRQANKYILACATCKQWLPFKTREART
ncbi:hypothetical protein EDD18DRAFT_1113820 [Armillaria luteobubalina]|uniref:Uncharacterized protein n=1 Tax=Armillaria luteobubalina TaxID=153913 RepID=A0AA39U7W8_9AGAR|nr:hypothetical protein EDD18DRAFT_1113820 [Armillaria luteobubalina]